jgi:enoyl-CoA hydratase/carnithine racemase
MADAVLKEKDGDITIITLNRPEVGNRQTDEVWAQVTEMFNAASTDSRAVVFKGAGEDFCLGRAAMGAPAPVQEAYAVRNRAETIFDLYGAFRNCKAPIVGVVQGRAAGLGCALAALCDITIASDKAKFSFPEMAHRIMPTIAFSALVDRLSRKAATYMIYSTEEVDAQTALAYGLVSSIAPANQLDASVARLLAQFKKIPLPAMLAAKEYGKTAFEMSPQAATDFARNLHATVNSYSKMKE